MLTSSFDLRAPPPNSTVIEVGEVPLSVSTILPKHMTTTSHLFLKYPNSLLHSQCGLDFLFFMKQIQKPLFTKTPPHRNFSYLFGGKYTDKLLGVYVKD